MIKTDITTALEPILSPREIEVVLRRLDNKHLTQTESNYLSRSIRPKLRSAEFAASQGILSLLDYRRRKYERKNTLLREKIINATEGILEHVRAIILFGSYVRNNHTRYRDIDVMVVVGKKLWKSSAERHRLKAKIENNMGIAIDVRLIVYSELLDLLPYSPLLQTELEDYAVVYGDINIPKEIIVDYAYLYRKLLEVEYVIEMKKSIAARYIYNAIRNCLSIELFLSKVVDNRLIIMKIEDNIGKTTAVSLLENNANPAQRDIALRYLNSLYSELLEVLRNEQKRPA